MQDLYLYSTIDIRPHRSGPIGVKLIA